MSGWAFAGSVLLRESDLGRYVIKNLNSDSVFGDILASLNGNFAVVVSSRTSVFIGADAVRSIPVFFCIDGNVLTISDDIHLLLKASYKIDRDSAIEYLSAGYVTGAHTLFSNVSGLQAGECVTWNLTSGSFDADRYYSYTCSYDSDISPSELCEKLDKVLTDVFGRLINSIDGNQIIVPLSGGLDSRLMVATLKKFGYDNVMCYSYGVPGNKESVLSSQISEKAGYPWIQIPYSPNLWRETASNEEFREYQTFAANGGSFPHHDDWPAVSILRQNPKISKGAIFVPGHTGDFISGDHLKHLFDPFVWDGHPHDIKGALVQKHYSLWRDFVRLRNVRNILEHRMNEILDCFPRQTDEDAARMYEYWEWQERQSKSIINSVRVYEFFGFSWRIPYWDQAFMEFWKPIPISLKMRKYLYRRYVNTYDKLDLFVEDEPLSTWIRESHSSHRPRRLKRRIFDLATRMPMVMNMFERYKMYKKHLREWEKHPLGEAQAYGKIRYLLSNSGKRHVQALGLKDFLLHEYCIDMSELKRPVNRR